MPSLHVVNVLCMTCQITNIFFFVDLQIDTLSRINHKNFVNLLGYCEEDEPFMRMMVFEYSPNGSLYEHLHGKKSE